MTYGKKAFLLTLQCVLLMIGALSVYVFVFSREISNLQVSNEITEGWGGEVRFKGVKASSASNVNTDTQRPSSYTCDATVDSRSLHRGIYEAEVFTANLGFKAVFDGEKLRQMYGPDVAFTLDFPENRIDRLGEVTVNGKPYRWIHHNGFLIVKANIADIPDDVVIQSSFATRGSGGLYLTRVGYTNKITIDGKAANPSFQGSSLPLAREVGDSTRFSASWEGTNTSSSTLYSDYVGTKFLTGVDRYQKVTRTLKYSFIIIILTYIAVFLTEILRRRSIPLLNYFLIGAALVIYYTLLLSFVELMAFGWAYLVAAVMTVGLISVYMGYITKSKKMGLTIGGILTLYYGACYVMLVSTYALLLGSILLFCAVALLMFATLYSPQRAAPPALPSTPQ